MAKEQPFEVIESNYNKLEDLKNCCESLNQKIGYLQVDLFNHPDAKLEKFLGEFNGEMSRIHQSVIDVFSAYETDKYFPAKGIETFNSTDEENDN
jgi:GTP:adenosylcobinamide-phosphate guanylyltransferase